MVAAIFLMKKDKKEEKKSVGGTKSKTAGELRLQKEMMDLEKSLDSNIKLTFPDKNNIMEFEATIKITEEDSYWNPATYKFNIKVPPNYPHEPPKCLCTTKIYHPNIDLAGNVCLNILRADWKPILGMSIVLIGLKMLFLDPNSNDPLNHEAAGVMRVDIEQFKANVKKSLKGQSVSGESFPKLI
jgi:ubiquitin-conjugating enzyme E2 M